MITNYNPNELTRLNKQDVYAIWSDNEDQAFLFWGDLVSMNENTVMLSTLKSLVQQNGGKSTRYVAGNGNAYAYIATVPHAGAPDKLEDIPEMLKAIETEEEKDERLARDIRPYNVYDKAVFELVGRSIYHVNVPGTHFLITAVEIVRGIQSYLRFHTSLTEITYNAKEIYDEFRLGNCGYRIGMPKHLDQ